MLEGSRLRHTVAVYRDVMTDQSVTDFVPSRPDPKDPTFVSPIPNENPESKTVTVKAGTRILVDLTTVSHDPAAFPDPETVKLDRPLDSYVQYGWGPHRCLGMEASRVIMTAIFKTVVGLKDLQKVDGPRGSPKNFPVSIWNGQVGRHTEHEWTGLRAYMTADQSSYWPIPTTMRVRYRAS